jgi:hypothetical protein
MLEMTMPFRGPWLRAVSLAAVFGVGALQPAAAAAGGPFQRFAGSWSGSGEVVGTKGDRERIRCRANYSEAEGGAALNQSIVCASASYRIDITSYVQASGGAVEGYWRESTRNVNGQLVGSIEDGHFDGNVSGSGFTAQVSLTARGRRQVISIRPQGGDISDVRVQLERGG